MPSISDPLVLPEDVTLIPVDGIEASARAQLEADDGDVLVSRANQRTHSKVVDAETAALLALFATPKTVAQAVFEFGAARGLDPQQTLQDVFPVLRELINQHFLVTETAARESPQATGGLGEGSEVGPCRVIQRLRHMEDTELYLAQAADGARVVLKIQQPDTTPMVARQLAHEAAALRRLGGHPVVELLAEGEHEGRRYLVLPWCEGIDVARAADELRESRRDRRALLDLCLRVLDAYTQLHRRGAVHGDIHPGNILVDADGTVRLIDFGLARSTDAGLPLAPPLRGGVSYFLEPEYAQAAIERRPPPDASGAGEQYALAALLYHLLTGGHYLPFSLVRDTAYAQIANDAPLPFAEHRIEPWPPVEQVLGRALAKQAPARFASIAEFAGALREAGAAEPPGAPEPADARAAQAARTADELLAGVLRRAARGGEWFESGITRAPTASVNYGAAGLAYFLYRVAANRQDPALLALADIWITRALRSVEDDRGFYAEETGISLAEVGRITPYHTPSGLFAVRYLIAHAMGDPLGRMQGLNGFVATAQQACEQFDLALGRSGVLLACSLLNDTLDDPALAEDSGLAALAARMQERIWRSLDAHGPIGPHCGLRNLGIAHGWAGALYATLRWCESAGLAPPPALRRRLDELARCAEPVDRGVRWPWECGAEEAVYMPGWCNGSAGHVLLWTLAARLYDEPGWLALAERAGWNAWEDPALVPTLCCGLAGRGYAMLALHRATGRGEWLVKARRLAEAAALNLKTHPADDAQGYEHSLYKGEVGVACLVADLEAPAAAVLPFFESEYAR